MFFVSPCIKTNSGAQYNKYQGLISTQTVLKQIQSYGTIFTTKYTKYIILQELI